MAKADNKPKINTLKGDRARLAERSYQERLKAGKGKSPAAKPKAAPKAPSAPAKAPASTTAKPSRLQTYLKNSTSQIKSGIRDLKRSPKGVLKRLFKSMPQGRSARLAVGALAGAGAAFTAGGMVDRKVTENAQSAAQKRKAYEAARDDVPSVPAEQAAEAPAKAPAKQEKAAPAKAPAKQAKASSTKTKGGDYPVYSKSSSKAAEFRAAFAAARKAGKQVFTWEGRKYNTKLKGE